VDVNDFVSKMQWMGLLNGEQLLQLWEVLKQLSACSPDLKDCRCSQHIDGVFKVEEIGMNEFCSLFLSHSYSLSLSLSLSLFFLFLFSFSFSFFPSLSLLPVTFLFFHPISFLIIDIHSSWTSVQSLFTRHHWRPLQVHNLPQF
jgi:hypothetical protein